MKNFIVFMIFLISGTLIYYSFNISKATVEPIKPVKPNYEITEFEKNLLVTPKESEYGLVNLTELNTNLCIELRYASENNFTEKKVYPYCAKAFLLESTAEKLSAVNEELYALGYRIKIWDAYRPHKYQYILRDIAEEQDSKNTSFIANPDKGSNHNRGTSVDITLITLDGHEVDMPTEFDHFGPESSIYFDGCSKIQKENRELLGKTMEKHGFKRINNEWWHFDDADYANYDILEVDFNELF